MCIWSLYCYYLLSINYLLLWKISMGLWGYKYFLPWTSPLNLMSLLSLKMYPVAKLVVVNHKITHKLLGIISCNETLRYVYSTWTSFFVFFFYHPIIFCRTGSCMLMKKNSTRCCKESKEGLCTLQIIGLFFKW